MEAVLRFTRGLSKRTRSLVLAAIVVPLVLTVCAVSGIGSSRESLVIHESHIQSVTPDNAETPSLSTTDKDDKAAPDKVATYFAVTRDHGFLDEPERVILDRLTHGRVIEVKDSPGGRSVAFRVKFADGTRGFYKPEQTFSAAHWYSEVVAYYLDRALGLKRVPPTVSRRMRWAKLSGMAEKHPRKNEVVVNEDGTVKGALIWWLPKRLVPLETPAGWENWVRIEPWPKWKISPCQRPIEYAEALTKQRAARGKSLTYLYYSIPEPDRDERAAELSDMIVFDFLTHNVDRWGGNNCNVLLHGPGGPLIFLDNGAGFSEGPARTNLMDVRLEVVQRFRRKTIDALRKLDLAKFKADLNRDRLAPLLSDQNFKGLEIRRSAVLRRVTRLTTKFGEKAVYPW